MTRTLLISNAASGGSDEKIVQDIVEAYRMYTEDAKKNQVG